MRRPCSLHPRRLLASGRSCSLDAQTDEAKSDLARLAKIRKEREAAAAATKAEKEGAFAAADRQS